MIEWTRPSTERIRAMTEAGYWRDQTALDFLQGAVAECPDQAFVTDHNSMTGRSTTVSYREMDRLSRRIAACLVHHGIRRGDVVALQLPNWWEFVALHLACMRIGAVTNPLMPIFREHELRFMLSHAETRALFIPARFRGFDYQPMIDALRPQLPDLQHVFVLGGQGEHGFETAFLDRSWEDEGDFDTLFAERRPEPNDVVELIYTSGTTGEPKAVMHTSNTVVAGFQAGRELGIGAGSVALMGSPLAHQTGFLFGMMLPLSVAGRTVLMDIWNGDDAVRLIAEHAVTYTMGATVFLSDLLESSLLERFAPDYLEIFICGGAPVPRALVQVASQRLGATIAAGWGMTENGLVTVTRAGDPPEKVFGTDGKAWAGAALRVVDELGQPVAHGVDGGLEIRGASNFVGYLKQPQAARFNDGWFETGDIATLDPEGYVRLTGRSKDIIIRGGENIPVPEVEAIIYEHPAVLDVAVVAMPHARLGERGCAFVALRTGESLDFAGLRAHLHTCGLARNHWPEHLELVEDFPRTPSGKMQKFKLRQMAAAMAASGGG